MIFLAITQKRNAIIFSYHGEADMAFHDCQDDHMMSYCSVDWNCKCDDTKNNTYQCMRYIDERENKVLCTFEDKQNFVEYYDLNKDPYQLHNIPREKLTPKERRWIKSTLEELANFKKSRKPASKFFKNNVQSHVKPMKIYD